MKARTRDTLEMILAIAITAVLLFLVIPENAGATSRYDQRQDQDQHQDQHQEQTSESFADSLSIVNDNREEANSMSVETESKSTNVVLVPNNNTENCVRVFGLSFGNGSGAGGLGLPYRSKKCDYEQAADDAFAAGERETGWFWKCQNPNLYKVFKNKHTTVDQAQTACFNQSVGESRQIARIKELEENLAFVLRQREIDREKCKESKDRIADACGK